MTLRRLLAAAFLMGGSPLFVCAADHELVSGATPLRVTVTGFTAPTTKEIAQIQTNLGNINVELQPDWAPGTVTNFKRYIASGTDRRYTNTIIHRATSEGLYVIQGGGYKLTDTPLSTHITTYDAIKNEYKEPNAPGTIAMAKTNVGPDTATSEWFINISNNTTVLGPENNSGFTVFGKTIGGGFELATAIWALPRLGSVGGLPVTGIDLTNPGAKLGLANFVAVRDIVIVPALPTAADASSAYTYVATSSNPEIVRALTHRHEVILVPGTRTGEVTITVEAVDGSGYATGKLATTTTFTAANLLAFTTHPVSRTVDAGGSVSFTAAAVDVAGAAVADSAYQWFKTGSTTAVGTGATLTLNGLTPAEAGDYYATVTAGGKTITSASASLVVAAPAPGRVLNVSVRGRVERGNGALIGGFNLGTTGTDLPVVIRAVGPTLLTVGLPTALADPRLQLVRKLPVETDYGVVDNWGGTQELKNLFAQVGAGPLASDGSLDSALTRTLADGSFTAVVSTLPVQQGVCVLEIFDASTTAGTKQLTNFSGRGIASTGDDVLIIGFAISGNVPRTVLMRALGNTLSVAGLTGLLADPELTVYRSVSPTSSVEVGFSDDWKSGTTASVAALEATMAAVGAGRAPADQRAALEAREAALQLTLIPGNYTFVIRGKNATTGTTIGEVYLVD